MNAARIADDVWNSCKGVPRNLWITITRVKDSSKPPAERTARSLQAPPAPPSPYNPGARFPDFEVSFSSVQGGQPTGAVSMVATLAVALISALAVLAF